MEFDNSREFNITRHWNLFTVKTYMGAKYLIVFNGFLANVIWL
jgi:hypothetical protein